MDFGETAISAVFSTVVATAVALYAARKGAKLQERQELLRRIEQLNMIAITYPHLEDDEFCKEWATDGPRSAEHVQYDNYCCLVFNLLQSTFEHFKGNRRDIDAFFGVGEMVFRHARWWESSEVMPDNADGYPDPDFWKFIRDELAEARISRSSRSAQRESVAPASRGEA